MRRFAGMAAGPVLAALGACAPTPPPPPPPAPVAAAGETFQRAAYSGTKQRLDFLTTLAPDCSYMGASTYHFPTRPAHGTVETKSAREAPAYTQNNIHFRCNDRRVQGTMLYYTSAPGFTGPDRFSVEWISPAGLFYRRNYQITVK